MRVVVDNAEDYFLIYVGSTTIDAGSFEDLRKHAEKIRKKLVECGGADCFIAVDRDGVKIENFTSSCKEEVYNGVVIRDCIGSGEGRWIVDEAGVGDGTLEIFDGGVIYSNEVLSVDGSLDDIVERVQTAREIYERFAAMFVGADGIEVNLYPDESFVDVYYADVRYILPIDWEGGELPKFDGINVSIVDLTSDPPTISGYVEKDGILFSVFEVAPSDVWRLIDRWEPVARAVGAGEFEVGYDMGYVLSPFLAGVKGGKIDYYIEDSFDLKGAKSFFGEVGKLHEFEYQMRVVARLLEGFDDGLFDEYR